MRHLFTAFASRVAGAAGQPITFILAIAIVASWALSGPLFGWSDTWQLVINTGTTIVTFLMVFLIQNSQNRDAAAMQAKLDELLRAVKTARNEFIGIEHLTDAEIETVRRKLEEETGQQARQPDSATTSVARLLHRRTRTDSGQKRSGGGTTGRKSRSGQHRK
jgi:low affinity Fe/Cu permease